MWRSVFVHFAGNVPNRRHLGRKTTKTGTGPLRACSVRTCNRFVQSAHRSQIHPLLLLWSVVMFWATAATTIITVGTYDFLWFVRYDKRKICWFVPSQPQPFTTKHYRRHPILQLKRPPGPPPPSCLPRPSHCPPPLPPLPIYHSPAVWYWSPSRSPLRTSTSEDVPAMKRARFWT